VHKQLGIPINVETGYSKHKRVKQLPIES